MTFRASVERYLGAVAQKYRRGDGDLTQMVLLLLLSRDISDLQTRGAVWGTRQAVTLHRYSCIVRS